MRFFAVLNLSTKSFYEFSSGYHSESDAFYVAFAMIFSRFYQSQAKKQLQISMKSRLNLATLIRNFSMKRPLTVAETFLIIPIESSSEKQCQCRLFIPKMKGSWWSRTNANFNTTWPHDFRNNLLQNKGLRHFVLCSVCLNKCIFGFSSQHMRPSLHWVSSRKKWWLFQTCSTDAPKQITPHRNFEALNVIFQKSLPSRKNVICLRLAPQVYVSW